MLHLGFKNSGGLFPTLLKKCGGFEIKYRGLEIFTDFVPQMIQVPKRNQYSFMLHMLLMFYSVASRIQKYNIMGMVPHRCCIQHFKNMGYCLPLCWEMWGIWKKMWGTGNILWFDQCICFNTNKALFPKWKTNLSTNRFFSSCIKFFSYKSKILPNHGTLSKCISPIQIRTSILSVCKDSSLR